MREILVPVLDRQTDRQTDKPDSCISREGHEAERGSGVRQTDRQTYLIAASVEKVMREILVSDRQTYLIAASVEKVEREILVPVSDRQTDRQKPDSCISREGHEGDPGVRQTDRQTYLIAASAEKVMREILVPVSDRQTDRQTQT